MRPQRLDIEGFGAFRDPVSIDFTDADVFAIVGPTGHGKSTIIDAMCFALYGSIPRYARKDIAPLMTLGANETRVQFTFSLGTNSFIATRILRRNADKEGAKTRAVRLERVEPNGEIDVIAGSDREFDRQLEALLGLDFAQFTKCVVLPQGQFADFLKSSPGERVGILSALLDLGRYDRMAVAARERAKVASGRLNALGEERTRLGDLTDEQLVETRRRRDAVVALLADVEAAGPRDAELDVEVRAHRQGADAARHGAAALAAVEIPQAARTLADQIAAARAAVVEAEARADAAESEAIDSEAERNALPTIDALTDAIRAHRDRAGVEARIVQGGKVLAERAAAAEAANDALVAATTELEKRDDVLADAQHRHAHAELRSSLHVGEPCPVCEHEVTALPPKLRATELTNAKKSVSMQKQQVQKANADATKALTEFRVAQELLSSLQEQAAEFVERVEVFPDAKQADALLTQARAAQRAAQTARAEATKRHAEARTAAKHVAQFDDAQRKADAVMQAQRDAVIAAGLEPPAGDWNDLAEWAEATRPEYDKRAAELDDIARVRSAEREELFDELAVRAVEAGVSEPRERTLSTLALALAQHHQDTDERVRRTEE
jgi:exonuclease SbcC